jgi:hypothetical protein
MAPNLLAQKQPISRVRTAPTQKNPAELSFARRQHHRYSSAGQPAGLVNPGRVLQYLHNLVHQLVTLLQMNHLPPAEQNRKLHAMVLFEKLSGAIDFYAQIVRVNLRPQPDFFDDYGMLFLNGLSLSAFLLVELFAIIHYAAHGRVCARRHLHQIQPCGPRPLQGLLGTDYPHLFVLFVHQPDAIYANGFVYQKWFATDWTSPYLS